MLCIDDNDAMTMRLLRGEILNYYTWIMEVQRRKKGGEKRRKKEVRNSKKNQK